MSRIRTTAMQKEVVLSYHRVRGLCLLVVVFAVTIVTVLEDSVHSYRKFQFLIPNAYVFVASNNNFDCLV